MRRIHSAVLTLTIGLVMAGCGKDKSAADYQREKLQENLALYQSVAGRYTGLVTSKEDGQVLGAMELELRAETTVNSANGGESALGTPTLVGNIRFLQENIITLSALNSYYDPNSGAYSAQITIDRSGGNGSEQVVISGILASGHLAGEIGHVKYPGSGGRFNLKLGGKDISELVRGKSSDDLEDPKGSRQVSAYFGETKFQAGVSRPVDIVILQPLKGTAEDFLDLISPVKIVQVSFNYSQSLRILFSSAVLDARQGLLTGLASLTLNGQVQQMTLECKTSNQGNIICQHLTTGMGVTATTRAKYNQGKPQPPVEDPSNRQSVTKVFMGRGKVNDKARGIKLTVIKPFRGLLANLLEHFFPDAEKFVDVSITFSKYATISLTNIKWNAANGLLDGSSEQQTPTGGFTTYVQCNDFYFVETNKPFSCRYWSSRTPLIPMEFKPPFK